MLDKSVPYKSIIMKASASSMKMIKVPMLPNGFSFRMYHTGDAERWADIEYSVLEFETQTDAFKYFCTNYLPFEIELKTRCVFVVNSGGTPVATANAWFADSYLGHQATLHRVSVLPDYQQRGLGHAVIAKALSLFPEVEPNEDVFIHTQTWSYQAIWIYHMFGFHLSQTETVAKYIGGHKPKININEYTDAVSVLKKVMPSDKMRELIKESGGTLM